jgi:class 3 adenylate cyclase
MKRLLRKDSGLSGVPSHRLDTLSELKLVGRSLVRIGVDSGPVVVGAGAGNDTDVFGEAPNISAHVQALAPAGTVLITARPI